jgi:ADP-L-glycero-D-manno-heptose 6-epimerase
MIVVTGASGFIGSCLIGRLNKERFNDIVAVDDFKGLSAHPSHERTGVNLSDKQIMARIDRTEFHQWLCVNEDQVQFVFHIGARTDTTEFNRSVFDELNLNFVPNE